MKQVNDLLHERGVIVEAMTAMNDAAEAEKRNLTDEEQVQYDKLDKEQGELKARADRLHNAETLKNSLGTISGDPERLPLSIAPVNKRATDEYKQAFNAYARLGRNGIGHDVVNALQVGTDSEGGYIVPQEFETQIVEYLQDINEFRQFANVISTASSRKIPIESTLGTATWTAEEAAYTESDAAFGQVVLDDYKLGTIVKVSEELLQDAFFDVSAYLARNFAKRFGLAEETAFVTGAGSTLPTGLTVGGTDSTITFASNSAITTDEIIDVYHALTRPYRVNARWVINDSTAKAIRKLKDTTNQYLWQPGLQAGVPALLYGKPVLVSTAMPAIGTVAKSVVFGDLSGYTVADRQGVSVQRLDELYAANGQVGFRAWKRLDAKVTDTSAIMWADHVA